MDRDQQVAEDLGAMGSGGDCGRWRPTPVQTQPLLNSGDGRLVRVWAFPPPKRCGICVFLTCKNLFSRLGTDLNTCV